MSAPQVLSCVTDQEPILLTQVRACLRDRRRLEQIGGVRLYLVQVLASLELLCQR